MDQIKIGRFISECRKALNLTQRELGDRLCVSDKTVSKWECGKGMPDVSLMLPLCEFLGISVNELLSGERLDENHYKEKAEENMMDLIKEKKENKKKVLLSAMSALAAIIGGCTPMMLAGLLDLETPFRILLICIGVLVMFLGIAVAAALEWDAGTYECRRCGKRFVPTFGNYIKGPHTITTRQLKCPYCGEKSYCKRRLTH